jgi:hypothetical protein
MAAAEATGKITIVKHTDTAFAGIEEPLWFVCSSTSDDVDIKVTLLKEDTNFSQPLSWH